MSSKGTRRPLPLTRSATSILVGVSVWLGACAGQQSATEASTTLEPAPVQSSRPAASPQVLRGERLLAEGKVQEASALFEDAIVQDPNDARAWLDRGLVYEEERDPSEAEKAYRRATEIDGDFAQAYNNLGVLLRERGDLAAAVAMLERAAALDPNLAPARFNLALCYEETRSLEAAEREYLAAIALVPSDPVPRINLAMLYLEADRRDDALGQLREARPQVRTDFLLSIPVGEGFRRAGAPAEAVAVLENARDVGPTPPPTELLAELGLAQYALGDLDASIETMRAAVRQSPSDPALHYVLGTVLAKNGDIAAARQSLSRAVDLNPEGPYADPAAARRDSLK